MWTSELKLIFYQKKLLLHYYNHYHHRQCVDAVMIVCGLITIIIIIIIIIIVMIVCGLSVCTQRYYDDVTWHRWLAHLLTLWTLTQQLTRTSCQSPSARYVSQLHNTVCLCVWSESTASTSMARTTTNKLHNNVWTSHLELYPRVHQCNRQRSHIQTSTQNALFQPS